MPKTLCVLLALCVSVALASYPYYPTESAELLAYFSGAEFAEKCNANAQSTVNVHQVRDVFPYMGAEEPVVDLIVVGNGVQPRVVMILCGMDARGFITTEVCTTFLERLCNGDLGGDARDTAYAVAPFVNKRSRELLMHLWSEVRGEAPRSWQQLLSSVPTMYHRVMHEMAGDEHTWATLHAQGVQALQPFFQCFDGSYNLALLGQNMPVGWRARDETGYDSTLRNGRLEAPLWERAADDKMSDNGALALSAPETRILKSLFDRVAYHTVVEVIQSTMDGVLGPYETTLLGDLPQWEGGRHDEIETARQQSIDRARSIAKHHCPSSYCLGGAAAQARYAHSKPRTGTVVDFAITRQTKYALVLQIGQMSPETQRQMNPHSWDAARADRDCLSTLLPLERDDVVTMANKWTDVLVQMVKK